MVEKVSNQYKTLTVTLELKSVDGIDMNEASSSSEKFIVSSTSYK